MSATITAPEPTAPTGDPAIQVAIDSTRVPAMPERTEAAVDLRGVSIYYGPFRAVKDITFDVRPKAI
ncbi:MAG TPA: hypothetical protein VKB00_02545, partial [Candidatus Limnocylindrales bacterium]|nr:hypothetical protein [Candidatus Limnocylindrales bacterium]